MTRAAAMIACVLTQACAMARIEPGDTVYVSTLFTAEQAGAIIAAADEWDRATHDSVRLHMVIGDETHRHFIVPSRSVGNAHFGVTIRPWFRDDVTIQLDVGSIETFATDDIRGVKQVAMHELMHALGYEEHEPVGLMRENITPGDAPCIDGGTAALYCEMHPCPRGWVDTCVAAP